MKNRILAALLAVLMILPMMIGVVSADVNHYTDVFENEETKLATMKLAATSKNGKTELYYDEISGEIAVKNTENGQILLSNPYDIASKEISNEVKGQYLSQIFLNFAYIGLAGETTYYSYRDCVTYEDQMKITVTDNGLSIKYTLGDGRKELLLPLKIEVEKLDALLENLSAKDKRDILKLYIKYNPNEKDEDGNFVVTSESKRKRMIELYPISAEKSIYVINLEAKNIDTWSKAADKIAQNTDYTLDQLHADYEVVKEEADGDKFTMEEQPNFTFVVDYTVNNDGFTASFDAGSLEYNKEKYYVTSVTILPYMSAAVRNSKGYTFLPDGSGALIRFEDLISNNITDNFVGTLYGTDYALYQISDKNVEKYTMPVFGLNNIDKNGGYFAIIEDGDGQAAVSSIHTSQVSVPKVL